MSPAGMDHPEIQAGPRVGRNRVKEVVRRPVRRDVPIKGASTQAGTGIRRIESSDDADRSWGNEDGVMKFADGQTVVENKLFADNTLQEACELTSCCLCVVCHDKGVLS